jgi:hypothetical protein
MADHKLFIAWAFNRHCSDLHNADFEVCQDKACVRARGYENAQQSFAPDACPNCGAEGFVILEDGRKYCNLCKTRR